MDSTREKEFLQPGTSIKLMRKNESSVTTDTFHIMRIIGYGGESITYKAYLINNGEKNYGLLKEFYPSMALSLTRDSEGQLVHFKDRVGFNEFVYNYNKQLEDYISCLHFINNRINNELINSSGQEQNSIATFIDKFDIFFGMGENCKSVYTWSREDEVETFETFCRKAHSNYFDTPEYNLITILNAIRNLAECIKLLHTEKDGLLHRDIKPSNFGFKNREDKILPETINIFDISTICTWRNATWIESKGYTEPALGRERPDGKSDIYSIGVTLFRALVTSEDFEKEGCIYSEKYFEDIDNLVDSSKLIINVDPHPRMILKIKQILNKCLCSRVSTIGRYRNCAELINDLDEAIYYLLPIGVRTKPQDGFRWILKDVSREIENEEAMKNRLAIHFHLYKHPLYEHLDIDNENCNILIFGLGIYAQKFLDLSLQLFQLPNKLIKATVVSQNKTLIYDYLDFRPELKNFFKIRILDLSTGEIKIISSDNNTSSNLCSYGDLDFITGVNISDFHTVREILTNNELNYVFISFGNDELNKNLAEQYSNLYSGIPISYTVKSMNLNNSNNDGKIYPVFVNNDIKKEDIFYDFERMAFNVHLLWANNNEKSIKRLNIDFTNNNYAYYSSLSYALSVKYKLWSVIGNKHFKDDLNSQVRYFYQFILADPYKKNELIWTEHKRWVTEKICAGWKSISIKECTENCNPKDEEGKRHVCIVKSPLHPKHKLENRIKIWDNTKKSLNEFDDPLDRISLGLHRAYRDFVATHKRDYFDAIKRIAEISNVPEQVKWCYEQLDYILSGKQKNIKLFEKNWEECLEKSKQALQNKEEIAWAEIVISTQKAIKAIIEMSKRKNYREIDFDLIEGIPYILTYNHLITNIIPIDSTINIIKGNKKEQIPLSYIFRYIGASIIIRPYEMVFTYVQRGKNIEELNDEADNLLGILIGAVKFNLHKLESKMRLVIFYSNKYFVKLIKNTFCKSDILFKNIEVKYIFFDNIREFLSNALNEYINSLLLKRNKVLIDKDNEIFNKFLDIDRINDQVGYYKFNALSKDLYFEECENCEWINYINSDVNLNIKDILSMLIIYYDIEYQINISQKMVDQLWSIYRKNGKEWKNFCWELNLHINDTDELINIHKNEKEKYGVRDYYISSEYELAILSLIEILKTHSLLKEESNVSSSFLSKICWIHLIGKESVLKIIDDIISKKYILDEYRTFRDKSNDNNIIIRYDSFNVKNINLSDEIQRLLVELNNKGFLHNLQLKGKSTSFSYGTKEVKRILSNEGKMLEIKLLQDAINSGIFDDVVNGVSIFGLGNKGSEIDCILIKDFRMLIVECKAREYSKNYFNDIHIEEEFKKLDRRLELYGINAKGVFVLDCDNENTKNKILNVAKMHPNIHVITKLDKGLYSFSQPYLTQKLAEIMMM